MKTGAFGVDRMLRGLAEFGFPDRVSSEGL
jgi:hypothetical protein